MSNIDLDFLNAPVEPNLKKMIVPVLRKYWRYSKVRNEAIKDARVSRGLYKCNICKQEIFKRDEVQVDHIEPAQALASKLTTWYDLVYFISRLFVADKNQVQVCCVICHKIKTLTETKLRAVYRRRTKKSKK